MAAKNVLSRREFVKDTGGLLIGFSFAEGAALPQVLSAAAETAATPSPARLDAWLRIDGDGNVHVFTGKAEIGMGVETGLGSGRGRGTGCTGSPRRYGYGRYFHHRRSGRSRRQHVHHVGLEAAA